MKILTGLLVGILLSAPLMASSLPTHLSAADVGRVVGLLGPAGAMRLMRAADAYPSWPGIKLGVETMIVPGYDINGLGDGNGSIPAVSPVPRVYLSKGLFYGFDLTFAYLPSSLINTLATLGLGLRYNFVDEKQTWFSATTYFNYTGIDAYDSTFQGYDLEAGVVVSKDYVRAKPFLGAGLLLANGTIISGGSLARATQAVIHSFFGVEFELPVNVTFQLDLMNLTPSGSLLFSFHF